MKYQKYVLLLSAAALLMPAAGLSVSAEESSAAEDSVIDADSTDESSEESFTSGDYTYTLDGENAEIITYTGSDTDLVLPEELDGHPVTSLCNGLLAQKEFIVSVTLPASLTDIGGSCFFGCTSLESVSVAEGNTAFTVTDGVLFSADGEDLIVYPQAMDGTSYTIPDTVRELWSSSFSNTQLTEVNFPDDLLYIDDWAFANSAIVDPQLPDSVTEIGQYAFAYCTGITKMDFPEDLELLEAASFAGCSALTDVTFHDNLTEIQMASFAGTGLKEVTIPETVTSIGFCAFGYEEDMETTVDGFVIYGTVGSMAQTYCTSEDEENDYANNFTFRSVMSEEVSDTDSNTVSVTEQENLWQKYGRWILLGAGAIVLLVGGGFLIFAGGGKKKRPKKADIPVQNAPESAQETDVENTENNTEQEESK